jgi:hypothetical protein
MIKKLLLGAVFLVLFALPVSAQEIYPIEQCSLTEGTIYPIGDQERRGCCSSHKGVCGCVNGRVKCCDGTLSPSCTC